MENADRFDFPLRFSYFLCILKTLVHFVKFSKVPILFLLTSSHCLAFAYEKNYFFGTPYCRAIISIKILQGLRVAQAAVTERRS